MAELATPAGFEFIGQSLGLDVEQLAAQQCGCECQGPCSLEASCPCCQRNSLGQPLYDGAGRLLALVHGAQMADTIFECSPQCSCNAQCANAVTQRASRARLRLVQVPGKGLGVVTVGPLPAGTFVSSYVGEYITTEEAQRRLQQYDVAGQGHALLVVREVLPSGGTSLRVNIDATRKGNLARFFNHSCDGGNLELITVRHLGALLPRAAFFARKDVPPDQELTFAYAGMQYMLASLPQGHQTPALGPQGAAAAQVPAWASSHMRTYDVCR
ncbi:hypothetical protein N2152v2_004664 [Parachlorella kessleri]